MLYVYIIDGMNNTENQRKLQIIFKSLTLTADQCRDDQQCEEEDLHFSRYYCSSVCLGHTYQSEYISIDSHDHTHSQTRYTFASIRVHAQPTT